jgi:hypothetical protein
MVKLAPRVGGEMGEEDGIGSHRVMDSCELLR